MDVNHNNNYQFQSEKSMKFIDSQSNSPRDPDLSFSFEPIAPISQEELEEILNETVEEKHYQKKDFKWNRIDLPYGVQRPSITSGSLVKFKNKEICLFGGVDTKTKEATNELWLFRPEQFKWEKLVLNEKVNSVLHLQNERTKFQTKKILYLKPILKCVEPCARCGHSSVVIKQDKMLVFGGYDLKNRRFLNDIWIFELFKKNWKLIVPGGRHPCPRWHCSIVNYNHQIFIFGGETYDFKLLSDLCIFSLIGGKWLETRTLYPTPNERMLHSACVINKKMYIIGGLGLKNNDGTCDIWCFDLLLFKWEKIEQDIKKSPFMDPFEKTISPLYGHSCFQWGNKIVIFGGKQNNRLNNNFWMFDTRYLKWEKMNINCLLSPPKSWKIMSTFETELKEILIKEKKKQIVQKKTKFYIYGGTKEISNNKSEKYHDDQIWRMDLTIEQAKIV